MPDCSLRCWFSIQTCSGWERGISTFLFSQRHSPNQRNHLRVFGCLDLCHGWKKQASLPSHTCLLSGAGTNRYMFAERLTASKLLPGATLEECDSTNLLCQSSPRFLPSQRVESQLSTVRSLASFCPFCHFFTLPELTFNLQEPAIPNALLHPRASLIPSWLSGCHLEISSLEGPLSLPRPEAGTSCGCSYSNWCLLQGCLFSWIPCSVCLSVFPSPGTTAFSSSFPCFSFVTFSFTSFISMNFSLYSN